MPKFINPWANDKAYIDLGILIIDGKPYDLYTLHTPGGNNVALGARYSDGESSYLSGEIVCAGGVWTVMGGPILKEAAQRFLAKQFEDSRADSARIKELEAKLAASNHLFEEVSRLLDKALALTDNL